MNVYSKKVLQITFNVEVKTSVSNLLNDLFDLFFTRTSEDRIISVEHINDVPFVKDAFVDAGLFESYNIDEFVHEIFVPNPSTLLLSIYVLVQFQDIVFWVVYAACFSRSVRVVLGKTTMIG